MLTPWMKMGYGVAETVAALCRSLAPMGVTTVVGCLGEDRTYADLDVRRARPDADSVWNLAAAVGATVVVAHGTPYFELLPELSGHLGTIAYEYGDPTPEMFDDEAGSRRLIAEQKRVDVYTKVSAVAAISDFIRHDIEWPDAHVIPLGIEHIADLGPKPLVPPPSPGAPLRVGTLMRLGSGEARYKGNDLLPVLRDEVARLGDGSHKVAFEVMGRGTDEDAAALRASGFTVHLNASDEQRTEFLRGIDVFVSPSQWEGCNLPLVEAQALGTPGLAFEVGAHPEFTPLVFSSVSLMAQQIVAYGESRDTLLRDHGRASYHYVRSTMSWELAAHRFLTLIRANDPGTTVSRRPWTSRARITARRARASLRRHGPAQSAKHLALRVVGPRRIGRSRKAG
jgi:hypothetical protein